MSGAETTSETQNTSSVENTEENLSASVQSDENTEASDTSDESLDTDVDETDDQEDDQNNGDDKKPKKRNVHKRIGKLTKNLSAARQEAEYWKQAALKSQGAQQEPKQTNQSSVHDDIGAEPDPGQFETNAEYIKALNKYHRELDKAEAKKEAEAGKSRETQERISKEYNSKLESFKKVQPDFDEVISDFAETYGDFKASPAVIEALMTSDYGPNVLYEILNDHAEYERLAKLSDAAIIREIGKIEARIQSKKEAEKSNSLKTSKAPAPISPLGKGTTPVAKSLSDPNISFADYEKLRRKQSKKY